MKIGINGFEAVIPRFGYGKNGLPNRVGSSEVCYQILVELEKLDHKNDYLIYLPVVPTSDMPKSREGWRYKVVPNTKLWTIFGLTKDLFKKNVNLDVFFSPTHYGPLYTPCPEVISILDVSYKYFPELFNKKDLLQLATWGRYTLKRAKRVITISESSKNDIIKEYKVLPQKVVVTHLGVKESLKSSMPKKELFDKYSIDKPYVLFVGTLQPRKNIVRLIKAFSKISEEYDLVIVGRRGWMFEEILDEPKKLGIESRVKFLESVSNEELPAFYENAEVFVLPSLYEGFGLPVLEAMKYGCPVATSNISSLPEAGGDAAIYFDPEDVEDITKKIEKVLSDKDLKSDMIKKGHIQVKKFSWEKTAKEVLNVLEEAGKSK